MCAGEVRNCERIAVVHFLYLKVSVGSHDACETSKAPTNLQQVCQRTRALEKVILR